MENNELTSIPLSKKTRDRLSDFGKKGETYDQILNTLMDFFQENKIEWGEVMITSINGLRELMKMKISGIPLPKNYKFQVRKYLQFKRHDFEKNHKNCCERCYVKQQWFEAYNIAIFLGVLKYEE